MSHNVIELKKRGLQCGGGCGGTKYTWYQTTESTYPADAHKKGVCPLLTCKSQLVLFSFTVYNVIELKKRGLTM